MQNVSGEHQPQLPPQPVGQGRPAAQPRPQPYPRPVTERPKRSIWGCLLSAGLTLLLSAGLIVLGVLLYQSQDTLNSTQNKLHRTRDDLADASAKLKAQDKAIAGLNSQVDSLNIQLSKAKTDLSSARSQINDLEDQLPVKVTVINNFGQPQLLGFDNTIWFYVRVGGTVSFYIKPGTYHVVACHPDDIQGRSNCSDWGNYTVDKDENFTIHK